MQVGKQLLIPLDQNNAPHVPGKDAENEHTVDGLTVCLIGIGPVRVHRPSVGPVDDPAAALVPILAHQEDLRLLGLRREEVPDFELLLLLGTNLQKIK